MQGTFTVVGQDDTQEIQTGQLNTSVTYRVHNFGPGIISVRADAGAGFAIKPHQSRDLFINSTAKLEVKSDGIGATGWYDIVPMS